MNSNTALFEAQRFEYRNANALSNQISEREDVKDGVSENTTPVKHMAPEVRRAKYANFS